MNQDVASGVYDFPAREYGAVSGRWPSPDPADISAAHPGNPQSWNRYAYVQNDPLRLTDPQGLDCAYSNADGTVTVYEGDCLSDTDSGVYVDCDGCLTTSAGVTITQDNYGNETLTDSAGDVFSIGEAGFDPGTYFTPEGVLLNQMNQINQLMQQMPPPGALPESLLDAMIQDGSINILQQTGAMLNDPLFYAGWYALPAAAEGCAATGGSQCVAVGLLGTIVTNFVLNSYEQYELGPPVHVPGAEPVGPSNPPEQPPISGPGPQGPDPLPTAP
jgi:RHS repeat-associated protein